MVLPLVQPDITKMLVGFLRAQPEVVALCGNSSSIKGRLQRNVVYPAVRVSRISDEPVPGSRYMIEAVRVQFDCWGGDNRQAERLAQAVKSAVLRRGPGYGNDEGGITNAIPRGQSDVPDDSFEPARERYILELEVWVRPILD